METPELFKHSDEYSLTPHPLDCLVKIYTGSNFRETYPCYFVWNNFGNAADRDCTSRPEPPVQNRKELRNVYRLSHMVIHAHRKTSIPVICHGACRHRNNRYILIISERTHQPCGLKSVHN